MDERRYWQGEDAREAPDDLDRLMARLAPPQAPRTLVPAILAETTRREQSAWQRISLTLWLAYGALLMLVAAGAVLLGQALIGTGTLDYVAFAASDTDLLLNDPGLFREAVFEHMPWGNLAALVVVLVAWAVVTVVLLKRSNVSRAPGMMAGATR